jgi:hypothetical protein
MGKKLFAVSTVALLVSFVAGWAVSDSQARVDPVQTFETTTAKQMPFANYSYHARFAPAAWVQVNTFEMMISANRMPSEHFADYSFVF